jgi:hypothetical protein
MVRNHFFSERLDSFHFKNKKEGAKLVQFTIRVFDLRSIRQIICKAINADVMVTKDSMANNSLDNS